MNRSESQFRRDQSERLLKLAQHCPNEEVRNQLRTMAKDWRSPAKRTMHCKQNDRSSLRLVKSEAR
jgi:hypothetical protein